MSIRCAWCNTELTPDEAAGLSGRRIARPLCVNCAENFVFQMGVPLQTFLDSLPAPILVVDNNVEVQAANRLGLELLGKDHHQVLKKLGGIVFECAYARLPEGCGRTVHCSGCAIRRSVYHTYETGESLHEVPATLAYGGHDNPQRAELVISTEKMGEVVLLRVDKMAAPVKA